MLFTITIKSLTKLNTDLGINLIIIRVSNTADLKVKILYSNKNLLQK